MQDSELEALLTKYRPAPPPEGLQARLLPPPAAAIGPEVATSRSSPAWPWALAAAALLFLTVGLYVGSFAFQPRGEDVGLDDGRVAAVAAELGGPQTRVLAEYIVRQEQRADAEAQRSRMNAPGGGGPR